MKLEPIGTFFVDKAWKEGADCLAAACDESEVTPSQLKMILSRGERTLIRMDRESQTVGWGVVRVDQLPNVRALHIWWPHMVTLKSFSRRSKPWLHR